MLNYFRRSVKRKLIGLFSLLLFAAAAFTSFYFPAVQERQVKQSLVRYVEALGDMVAFATGNALGESNFELVQEAFNWATRDSSVIYVALYQENNQLLVEHNPDHITIDAVETIKSPAAVEKDGLILTSALIEYKGVSHGHLLLGYSLADLQTRIHNGRLISGFISLLILAIGIGVILLISKLIVNPVLKLSDAADRVSQGDLDTHVTITTTDEIGTLGHAFNHMVEHLKETIDHLAKANQNLHHESKRQEELLTSLKRSEQELKQAKDAAEAVSRELASQKFALDQHSIVAVTDDQGRITYVNEKFCEISKFSREELIGQDHRIVNSGHHPKSFWKKVWTTIGQGDVWKGEVKNRRKDGTFYWVETTIVPFLDNSGKPYQYIAIRTDITERVQAEMNLLRAKEEAEEATRAKSEFLANMSHEIRTPMNGVIGMTELLLDTDLNKEQREYAQTVRGSAESLLTIINDILDFSKIEAGKLDLEYIDFDLRTTIEEVADLLAFKAEDKGLAFSCFLHPEVEAFVNGDPGRLRQILINLANNALKFTKHGEVAIRGEVESQTETEIGVRFSVSDTGIGIPEEARRKLFQPFSQVDASTTRKFGGTGLGLTISKQLAEMMGGEIGVDSRQGEGSTFWFTAKLRKQPRANRRKRLREVDLRGTRILVIDDNKTNRDILRLQLSAWHCIVEEAEDATQALHLLRLHAEQNNAFDIAFVDMQMPGMDGEELGRIIKKDPAIQDTILIMFTSMGKRGDAKRMSKIGFRAYLTKPLKQSQLYDCLVSVLSHAPPDSDTAQIVTRHTITEGRKLKLHILLAEDNLVNQKVASKMLQKLGCEVDIAANGQQAVDAVKANHYDIVLMDCQMPVMDGFEATHAIRAWEQENATEASEGEEQHIPIIALTANAMQGDREACLNAGMNDHVAKPMKAEELRKTIEKWTSPRQDEQQRQQHDVTVVDESQSDLAVKKS